MKTTITAKNMIVTPGITNRITKKTAAMERYLRADTEMFVRLRKERDEASKELTELIFFLRRAPEAERPDWENIF